MEVQAKLYYQSILKIDDRFIVTSKPLQKFSFAILFRLMKHAFFTRIVFFGVSLNTLMIFSNFSLILDLQ